MIDQTGFTCYPSPEPGLKLPLESLMLGPVQADKLYDDYWAGGKHASEEWTEQQFRRNLAPLLDREQVLDYGCGLGYAYQRRLVGAVKHYVGADVSPSVLEDLRRKGLDGLKINPDLGSLDCSAAIFDGAVCSEVFEHLFDPLQAAREIHRVLKPGGVLVATVPNFGYHAWRLLAFLRAQVPLEPESFENRWRGVHIRFFSALMLRRLLRAAGFVDIRIGSFDRSSVWDVFLAAGHISLITSLAHRYLPGPLHLRFLQDIWPNVFASRLRAVAWKHR